MSPACSQHDETWGFPSVGQRLPWLLVVPRGSSHCPCGPASTQGPASVGGVAAGQCPVVCLCRRASIHLSRVLLPPEFGLTLTRWGLVSHLGGKGPMAYVAGECGPYILPRARWGRAPRPAETRMPTGPCSSICPCHPLAFSGDIVPFGSVRLLVSPSPVAGHGPAASS